MEILTIISDINSELDELDREEFYRLKKVQDKKQRDAAASEVEKKASIAAKAAMAAEHGVGNTALKEAEPVADMTVQNDDDIIF